MIDPDNLEDDDIRFCNCCCNFFTYCKTSWGVTCCIEIVCGCAGYGNIGVMELHGGGAYVDVHDCPLEGPLREV